MSSGVLTTAPLAHELAAERELPFFVDERTRRVIELRSISIGHDRGWLIRRALAGADVLALWIAFVASSLLVGGATWLRAPQLHEELAFFGASLPLWIVLAKVYGLYDRDGKNAHYSSTDDLGPIFHMVTVAVWSYLLLRVAVGFGAPSLLRTSLFWIASVPLVCVARAGARTLARTRVEYLQNTVIVGAGDVGQMIASKFLKHPEFGINIVGFVDSQPKARREDLEHLVLLGPPERLPSLVRMLDVERVVIAFSNEPHEEVLDLVRELRDLHVQIDIVPRLFDLIGPGVEVHSVEGVPLVALSTLQLSRSSGLLKRALDLVVSSVALFSFAPLFALIALAVRLDSKGPVFFRQTRMGEGGKPFVVFKFRTMVADAEERKHELLHLNRHLLTEGDARMFKVVGDPRVTRVGRLLRKYFLDELPQLVNVLRGQMSLIGPRPLILEEAQYVDSWGRRRLELRPGMTGVWQVLGRSAISFEEMVKLDYLYVTTWSLGNDLRLLVQTIPLVLRGEEAV